MEAKIVKTGRAGSLESNDLIVEIEPADDLIIEIKSVVEDIFKDQIENVVRQTLKDLNIDKAKIRIDDRGALDFTISARVETAVKRAL
ncbi:citrate lyase acyl carrier protein [uncultured Ezakiella sp.]|uniref:citrate lyase acyl carrier protein n=1 Tax=uncultured Ezakiella sp. TaxID=1637529 RepID=UPI0025D27742|nr:citrate lyase acyl carrier protein [uncultured Ezakiella sp.]